MGVHLNYRFEPGSAAIPEEGLQLENPLFRILAAVREGGSISCAAKTLGLSYRYVWGFLKEQETALGRPLLAGRAGQSARFFRIRGASGVGRASRPRPADAPGGGTRRPARQRASSCREARVAPLAREHQPRPAFFRPAGPGAAAGRGAAGIRIPGQRQGPGSPQPAYAPWQGCTCP